VVDCVVINGGQKKPQQIICRIKEIYNSPDDAASTKKLSSSVDTSKEQLTTLKKELKSFIDLLDTQNQYQLLLDSCPKARTQLVLLILNNNPKLDLSNLSHDLKFCELFQDRSNFQWLEILFRDERFDTRIWHMETACKYGATNIVDLLLQYETAEFDDDEDDDCDLYEEAFYFACRNEHTEVVRLFLK